MRTPTTTYVNQDGYEDTQKVNGKKPAPVFDTDAFKGCRRWYGTLS